MGTKAAISAGKSRFVHKRYIGNRPFVEIMQYTIILESQPEGGYSARALEIPGTLCFGSTQKEALASIREAIVEVRYAQNREIHDTMSATSSEIIKIEVADTA